MYYKIENYFSPRTSTYSSLTEKPEPEQPTTFPNVNCYNGVTIFMSLYKTEKISHYFMNFDKKLYYNLNSLWIKLI